ncbi:MAG: hypothetical protein HZB41_12370 [Ignavibacteriae bacterium]|nr:hypothetical protein [Ignavibacteriota bacterium]
MKSIILYCFIILIVFTSCELFTTREPEKPDTGKSVFIPPYDANDVITNFTNSIKEKNADNFKRCFWENSEIGEDNYTFVPSADAYSLYQSIFDNWDINSERSCFLAIITKLADDTYPELEFTNSDYLDQLPGSKTFISDYKIIINHNIVGRDKIFAGKLQFYLKLKSQVNYWYIQKWIDTNPSNDSIKSTWSILKAQFAQ